ncbi:MAG: GNAT family N-acetyltransferase [Flavobacteriales bacterium]|nr:GNAT family N-acetyltransferase [Flavobacteriales bacterium]
MQISNLQHTSFNTIIECFFDAFENYFVTIPRDKDYFQKRWEAAKVNFSLSYGMFDGDQLVGFIIHAVDKRNGKRIAFNTGTGVLPAYRGKKILKSIYDFALDDLRKHQIEASSLEVIKENEIAVNAYKAVGFEISRGYKCFKGEPELIENVHLKLVDKTSKTTDELPRQEFYSWDNQWETIKGDKNYDFYEIQGENGTESYFVINPKNGYIPQFDLIDQNIKNWEHLFSGMAQISSTIKINNVDERLTDKLEALNKAGLDNFIDQYQMELPL